MYKLQKAIRKSIYKISTLGLLTLLVACQRPSPVLSTADSYLSALRSEDEKNIANLTCFVELPPREDMPPGILSWKLIEASQEVDDNDPLGIYTKVVAEIEYTGLASPVDGLFTLEIWKTDEIYQFNNRQVEAINQLAKSSNELLEQSNAILGNENNSAKTHEEPMEPPNRDKFTNQEYCVTKLSRF